MNLKTLFNLIKQTIQEGSEDDISRLAASLAYFTVFSLAPMLLIIVAVASLVIEREQAQQAILSQVQEQVGPEVAELVNSMMQNTAPEQTNVLLVLAGVATLLLGATVVFGQLQDAMNRVWDVEKQQEGGISVMIRKRVVSFLMIIGVGLLLLLSLALSSILSGAQELLTEMLGGFAFIGQVVDIAISLALFTFVFALLFRYIPDVDIAWRDVWVGAFITAVLFVIGKQLIGLYLGRGSISSMYGAASSLALLLVWVFYSSQIVLYGAEFTQVYARSHGTYRDAPTPAAKVDAAASVRAIEAHGAVTAFQIPRPLPATPPAGAAGGQDALAATQQTGGQPAREGRLASARSFAAAAVLALFARVVSPD